MHFITTDKIPVGKTGKIIFDWMQAHMSGLFDALSNTLQFVIDWIEWALQAPPPVVVFVVFSAVAWYLQRSWKTALFVFVALLFILNQGYWEATTQSLTLVLAACVVCMGIGVPIGIFIAHHPRAFQATSPILDLMQTLPTFVYLIPAIVLFGIGMVPGLIATVIFVLPAPIRMAHLGISSTPEALLEAATAFGASKSQRLWKVELPYAFPQIMVGLNQT
ncbi:MAG: ABC transporter permease subunit, partial [Paracoccaceae bacterium]|nr:ABC transporter permease subunit [Paracoccaceae bacterium]